MENLKECRWSHVSSRLTTWSPGPDVHFGRSLQPDSREQESRDSSSHKSCIWFSEFWQDHGGLSRLKEKWPLRPPRFRLCHECSSTYGGWFTQRKTMTCKWTWNSENIWEHGFRHTATSAYVHWSCCHVRSLDQKDEEKQRKTMTCKWTWNSESIWEHGFPHTATSAYVHGSCCHGRSLDQKMRRSRHLTA